MCAGCASVVCGVCGAVAQEEGVCFKSPVDGSAMMLTPEKSMDIQNAIGADIMMMLDDVVSSKRVDYARVRGVVWCGVVWCGVVWSGLVWSGLVWSGLVWSGLRCIPDGYCG